MNNAVMNNGVAIWKKVKFDPYLTPHIRINSEWIRDLNATNEN